MYLCEHNANGALGVIINKATDMTVDVLLNRIDLTLEIAPELSALDKRPSCTADRYSRTAALSFMHREVTLRRLCRSRKIFR